MNRLTSWPVLAALFALALALGLAAGGESQVSSVPTVANVGPRGLKVLFTALTEAGFDVRRGTEDLSQLPADVRSVVVTAPTTRSIDADGLVALERLLERGGTVMLLVSRTAGLSQWAPLVSLRGGSALEIVPVPNDGAGATVEVLFPVGPLRQTRALRVASEHTVRVMDEGAVALTEPAAVWAVPRERGALYVVAGADLAENARLDLEDNFTVWANLAAQGPMWIDESLHQQRAGPPPRLNLWATGAQFLVVALAFVLARGTRLGPPLGAEATVKRSSSEYVDAMATLTERAGVEAELVEGLRRHVRTVLHEQLGLSVNLSSAEVARQLSATLGLSNAEAKGLLTDPDFLSLSQRVAALEARLSGARQR